MPYGEKVLRMSSMLTSFLFHSTLMRPSLIVQGDSGKIIDVERTKLCFLGIQMGNVRFWVFLNRCERLYQNEKDEYSK